MVGEEEIFGDVPLNEVVYSLRKQVEIFVEHVNKAVYMKWISLPIMITGLIWMDLIDPSCCRIVWHILLILTIYTVSFFRIFFFRYSIKPTESQFLVFLLSLRPMAFPADRDYIDLLELTLDLHSDKIIANNEKDYRLVSLIMTSFNI